MHPDCVLIKTGRQNDAQRFEVPRAYTLLEKLIVNLVLQGGEGWGKILIEGVAID